MSNTHVDPNVTTTKPVSVIPARITRDSRSLPQPRTRLEPNTLALNLFPAELSSTTVTVWAGKYPGSEEADQLRRDNPGLTTWRDPDDGKRMYVWNATSNPSGIPVGFHDVTVSLEESPLLFQRLMNDAVARQMRNLGFQEKGGGW